MPKKGGVTSLLPHLTQQKKRIEVHFLMTICFATHISALLLISCQTVTKNICVCQNTSAKIVPEKESVTLLIWGGYKIFLFIRIHHSHFCQPHYSLLETTKKEKKIGVHFLTTVFFATHISRCPRISAPLLIRCFEC